MPGGKGDWYDANDLLTNTLSAPGTQRNFGRVKKLLRKKFVNIAPPLQQYAATSDVF